MTNDSLHTSLPPLVPARGSKYKRYVEQKQAAQEALARNASQTNKLESNPVRPVRPTLQLTKKSEHTRSREVEDPAYYQHLARSDTGLVSNSRVELSPIERDDNLMNPNYERAESVPALVPCARKPSGGKRKGSKKSHPKPALAGRRYTADDISLPMAFKHICHVDPKGAENYRTPRRSTSHNPNSSEAKNRQAYKTGLSSETTSSNPNPPGTTYKSSRSFENLKLKSSPAPVVCVQPLSGSEMESNSATTNRNTAQSKSGSFKWDEWEKLPKALKKQKKPPPLPPATQHRTAKPKPPKLERTLVKRNTTGHTRSCEDDIQYLNVSNGYLSSPNAMNSPNALSGTSIGSSNAASSTKFSFKSAATAVPAAPPATLTYSVTR